MHASRGAVAVAQAAQNPTCAYIVHECEGQKVLLSASSRRSLGLSGFVLPSQLRKRSCAPHTDPPASETLFRQAGIARQSFSMAFVCISIKGARPEISCSRIVRRAEVKSARHPP
jgi:hypothetical protein